MWYSLNASKNQASKISFFKGSNKQVPREILVLFAIFFKEHPWENKLYDHLVNLPNYIVHGPLKYILLAPKIRSLYSHSNSIKSQSVHGQLIVFDLLPHTIGNSDSKTNLVAL